MNATERPTFSDLWRPYLEAHSLPTTRAIHYMATLWGVGWSLAGFITLNFWFIVAAIVGGYTMAAGSHFFVERRKDHGPWKPLVYPHIALAAGCTFYMFYLALTGRLAGELHRLEIGQPRETATPRHAARDAIAG